MDMRGPNDADVAEAIDELRERRKREQRRWHARGAKSAKQIMADLMVRRGLGRVLATEALHDVWRKVVGDMLAAQSQPGSLRGGTLDIIVTHTIFQQEMKYAEKQILTQLAQQAPEFKVDRLRYRVGQLAPQKT